MNTERPDNDDAGASGKDAEEARAEKGTAGAAEDAGTTRDAMDTAGKGASEEQGAREAGDTSEELSAQEASGDSEEPGIPEDEGTSAESDGSGDEAPDAEAPGVEGPEATADDEEAPAPDPDSLAPTPPGAEALDTDAPAPGAEAPPETSDLHVVAPEEGSAARPPRRRSPVAIASVAAAVLLVGGGGAYFAATASGGSDGRTSSGAPGGDGTPPPLALDGYSEGSAGIAPGEPDPNGVTYKAGGEMPDGPDSAPVYRVSGEVTQDQVAELAAALGVDGTPVAQGQAWTVGAKDAAGPSLQVNKAAPGTWTFHRYAPGTDDCESTTVCSKDPANPADDPVSPEAAEQAAAPILKAVGQDDAKIDTSQVIGAHRVVNANPVVGGMPTYGWTTGLTVGAEGEVVGGSGQLEAPVKGDTYPVLSAEKTLGLMNKAPAADHRMGIGGCASPVPLKDRQEAPCGAETGAPQQSTITVERAVFGLASHTVGGQPALVPSWLYEVRAPGAEDAFTVTHPAVDPKYLASPATSAPSGQPSTLPTSPGDEPTSAPAPREVAVEGYTAEGSELTVAFTGGVCADYEATAAEDGDKVTVTVTEKPWPGKVCIMIAKEYHQTVQLDEPLGDRKVVGADGKAVPLEKAGARLPETSGAR
ncbi:hypothetical protein AB0I98_33380 [Streptomyces sp. NPDC050211]|uniref:hypothetical protein n=1 Tax=Streptomyces sp. NPDC050211 TaxID=3154932 RepID=UPI00342B09D7